jgi:hypothetical protein
MRSNYFAWLEIGIVEHWKLGILGSGKLQQCFIDKLILTSKLINGKRFCKIIILLFQYSIRTSLILIVVEIPIRPVITVSGDREQEPP